MWRRVLLVGIVTASTNRLTGSIDWYREDGERVGGECGTSP